jgi:dienelactone hydrolase
MNIACTFSTRIQLLSGLFLFNALCGTHAFAQETSTISPPQFREYFQAETQQLEDDCLSDLTSLEDWQQRRVEYRRQLFEMLGLDPLPAKTDLQPTVTGTTQGEGFKVHNVHFQSMPHLYVTGNLYVPDNVDEKLPAILYLCGHGAVKKDGVSYGNKVHYHHHGAWFARNGYVCLTIDSLQLGEIEGIHHGTYRYDMWWWLNRGYTPAGVEAWNCIRALDYLQTLPEVDPEKIGVTGRSGGGAYSWWIAALDERIKVAVPVAGITDLQNHVVDNCVEGHCDCMYFVNTYRWDYPLVAALVAPRPLLFSNTDNDGIFPLDGVYRTYQKARRVYALYGRQSDIALHITAGPHKDTQELRIHAFRWFNHYLKGTDDLVRIPAESMFEPEQLRVFHELPKDAINANIHDTFVKGYVDVADQSSQLKLPLPDDSAQWQTMRSDVLKSLREKTFRAWPEESAELNLEQLDAIQVDGLLLQQFRFQSQHGIDLTFAVIRAEKLPDQTSVDLQVVGDLQNSAGASGLGDALTLLFQARAEKEEETATAMQALVLNQFTELRKQRETPSSVFVAFRPRGHRDFLLQENQKEASTVQIRRRFMLLGQTLDGMRVYDIRRAIQGVRLQLGDAEIPVRISATGETGLLAACAALYEPDIAAVTLDSPPANFDHGPYLLNVSRICTAPALIAMLGDQTDVSIHFHDRTASDRENIQRDWGYLRQVEAKLGRNQTALQLP